MEGSVTMLDVMQTESVKNSMTLKSASLAKSDGSGESYATEAPQQTDVSDSVNSSLSSIDKSTSKSNIEDIDKILEKLNIQFQSLNNYLRFEKDESTEKMVVFIKDIETDEVIRQIPSQELLAVSNNITKYLDAQKELIETSAYPPGLITHEQV